jgi:hypothetical protein
VRGHVDAADDVASQGPRTVERDDKEARDLGLPRDDKRRSLRPIE